MQSITLQIDEDTKIVLTNQGNGDYLEIHYVLAGDEWVVQEIGRKINIFNVPTYIKGLL